MGTAKGEGTTFAFIPVIQGNVRYHESGTHKNGPNLQGHLVGAPRLPLVDASAADLEHIENALKQFGL